MWDNYRLPDIVAINAVDLPPRAERLMDAREYGHRRLDDDRLDLLATCELASIKHEPRCPLKAVRIWTLATDW